MITRAYEKIITYFWVARSGHETQVKVGGNRLLQTFQAAHRRGLVDHYVEQHLPV